MEFVLNNWLERLVAHIKECFGGRVVFIGLQGSYARNEAHDGSDIDVVLILDTLSMQDLKAYREIVLSMPFSEKACGFIGGQEELLNWQKADLFQFYYDTKPIYGSLNALLLLLSKEDAKQAVKIGACNLYHACCHNVIYENSAPLLVSLYKAVFFILQAKYFVEHNSYIHTKAEMATLLKDEDKEMLDVCMESKKLLALTEQELVPYHEKMMLWSGQLLKMY